MKDINKDEAFVWRTHSEYQDLGIVGLPNNYTPVYVSWDYKDHYPVTWFCNENKIIHGNKNQVLQCPYCSKYYYDGDKTRN